jgi:mono/diheme cytochrome c family protein
MVANGADGNVRGQMVVPLAGSFSSGLPGAGQFLTYKGNDTRLSACAYYRSFGAVAGCDAQGNFVSPISLDDWRRQHKLAPYNDSNTEAAATYVNLHDLNLVRRMVATSTSSTDVAFVVCNSPGPQGGSQKEVDDDIATGLADEKRVACVAMEYSPTTGRSGGDAFTKFLTFGPDGRLIASINLDGRGEKYMPGACVACHGGTQYSGRFPEGGNPSPDLGAHFLPFDTGNYGFSATSTLTEASQSPMIHALNKLVLDTAPTAATTALIGGWYKSGTDVLDKQYLPPAWSDYDATTDGQGAAKFYRQVVATSCRTCHAAMESYNWDGGADKPTLLTYANSARICGGTADVVVNASMPNALISRDLMQAHIDADPALAALAARFIGCSRPAPDPVYPKR